MALVFTNSFPPDSDGNRRQTVTTVALDNLYTTGGYVVTPGQLGGLTRVEFGDVNLVTTVAAGPGAGYLDCTNPYAPKIKFQLPTHVGEMTASATLTGATAVVIARGEI
jgi:hypothetical protein